MLSVNKSNPLFVLMGLERPYSEPTEPDTVDKKVLVTLARPSSKRILITKNERTVIINEIIKLIAKGIIHNEEIYTELKKIDNVIKIGDSFIAPRTIRGYIQDVKRDRNYVKPPTLSQRIAEIYTEGKNE